MNKKISFTDYLILRENIRALLGAIKDASENNTMEGYAEFLARPDGPITKDLERIEKKYGTSGWTTSA